MNNLLTRSFLSYADLKKEAVKDLEAGGGEDEDLAAQTDMSKADKNLKPFFEEVGLVKEEMASIRGLLTILEKANEESKSTHKPDESHTLRESINAHIAEVLKTALRIRERLEGMDRANSANRRLSGCREGTAVDRIRSSATNGLRKNLKELMMDFQGLRQKMMSDYREEVERHHLVITGEVPSGEVVERMIYAGKGDVLETLQGVRDRHDAVKEVERSLLDLHQVFLDMAIIVEDQGEKMDDIEQHVHSAAHYVKGGAMELNSAKTYQRGSRKWLCISIALLLVLIMLVIIPIATSLRKS